MNLAPHAFTLRQLQYVVAIADMLSFRKAAERCHVSQPSLSAQVAAVEEALGVQLFERDRRGVLLTAAGEVLVERARRMLVEADDLVDAARRASDPLCGPMRLGVIPTISPYLLPVISPALRTAFPHLRAQWTEDKTPVLMASLGVGAIDAAILALEAELGDVESEPVCRDVFMLATPAGHPLGQGKKPLREKDLYGEPVLLLDEGHCFRTQALAVCAQAQAEELAFRATSLGTLTQMVAGGVGVTLLPRMAVATESKRADIQVRPFAEPAPFRTIALVWRPRSALGPALRRIAQVLAETMVAVG